MNCLEDNRYTRAWGEIGRALPRPKAIVCVSAHWYTRGTSVTAMGTPKTIHDFYGFPRELYELEYPAPGNPALAAQVKELLAPTEVALDHQWGLDHGTWAVLRFAYPAADVPVLQLSIDATQPAGFHYELGRRLAPLRDEGILVAGSGDVVHNLRLMRREANARPYDWAVLFNDHVREALARGDHRALVEWESAGEHARLSNPTPEHYLPLIYCLGAADEGAPARIAVDGIEIGSVSMLSVVLGAAAA